MRTGARLLAEGDSAPKILSQFLFLLGVKTFLVLRNPLLALKLLPLPEVVTHWGREVRVAQRNLLKNPRCYSDEEDPLGGDFQAGVGGLGSPGLGS